MLLTLFQVTCHIVRSYLLIFPLTVLQRRPIQLFLVTSPHGHVPVHQRRKPVIMQPLQQVHQFMGDDVLQAMGRFLDQFQVQPDATSLNVACPPFGFHPLHAPFRSLYTNDLLPLQQQRRDLLLQTTTVPFIDCPLTSGSVAPLRNLQVNDAVPPFNTDGAITVTDIQTIAPPPIIVGLAGHILPGRLAFLTGKLSLMFPDPSQLANHRQADGIFPHCRRGCHPYPAMGWIYPQMQILDCLAHR